jgi:hypothetical protein
VLDSLPHTIRKLFYTTAEGRLRKLASKSGEFFKVLSWPFTWGSDGLCVELAGSVLDLQNHSIIRFDTLYEGTRARETEGIVRCLPVVGLLEVVRRARYLQTSDIRYGSCVMMFAGLAFQVLRCYYATTNERPVSSVVRN